MHTTIRMICTRSIAASIGITCALVSSSANAEYQFTDIAHTGPTSGEFLRFNDSPGQLVTPSIANTGEVAFYGARRDTLNPNRTTDGAYIGTGTQTRLVFQSHTNVFSLIESFTIEVN